MLSVQSRVYCGVTGGGDKSGLGFFPGVAKVGRLSSMGCVKVGRSLRPLAFLSSPLQFRSSLEWRPVGAWRWALMLLRELSETNLQCQVLVDPSGICRCGHSTISKPIMFIFTCFLLVTECLSKQKWNKLRVEPSTALFIKKMSPGDI